MQTMLRVQSEKEEKNPEPVLRRVDIERGRRRLRSIASGLWQLFKEILNEVSVNRLGIPVEINMPLDLVIKCHGDSYTTAYVSLYTCL